MNFDPKRLKEFRKRKCLAAKELANKIGRDRKTIQRWENPKGEMASAPDDTVIQVARVLGVTVDELTGDVPMPDFEHPSEKAARSRIGADISPRSFNAYKIAKKRYGFSTTQIIEMAPLLLAFAAEGSLDFRRRNLKEAETQRDTMQGAASNSIGWHFVDDEINDLAQEEESIKGNDLFGEHVVPQSSGFAYYPPTGNPFNRYLFHLLETLSNKSAIFLDEEYEDSFVNGIPDFTLFSDTAQQLSGGDVMLAEQISDGTIELSNMPQKLWADDAAVERVAWFREQLDCVAIEPPEIVEGSGYDLGQFLKDGEDS